MYGLTSRLSTVEKVAAKPWVFGILLAAACLHQALQLHCYGPYGHKRFWHDLAMQMCAAQSCVDGHGLTYPVHSSKSIETQRKKLSQWPLGYSVLFAALLAPHGDPWLATCVLDSTSIVLFFGSWFVIMRMLQPYVRPVAALLVWFYWAFIWNPLALLQGANLFTVAIFSCGMALCLASVHGLRPGLTALGCGICVALAAACRYAYWPLVIVPPVSLLFCWFATDRRRSLLGAALLSGTVAAGLLVLLAGFNKWYVGDIAQYTGSSNTGGLQWQQLTRMDYFPARMIGFSRIWQWFSERTTLDRILPAHAASWKVSALVMIVAAIPLVSGWRSRRGYARGDAALARLLTFACAGVLTLGLTVAMLGFLSVTVAPLRFASGQLWTYLEQPRYYAPVLGFLSVALASGIVKVFELFRAKPWIYAVLAALMLAWFVLGIGFRAKTWIKEVANYENVRTARQLENRASREIHAAVREQLEQGRTALFLSFSPRRPYPPFIPKTPYSVRIAGGCTLNPDFLQSPLEGGDPPRALFVLIPADAKSGPAESVSTMVESHEPFRPVARLQEGQVYMTLIKQAAQQ